MILKKVVEEVVVVDFDGTVFVSLRWEQLQDRRRIENKGLEGG